MDATLALLESLGLQVATHKLQQPATRVTWLGINIDLVANRLSIPEIKLGQIQECMATASWRAAITKKHLQKIVRAARTFICRLLDALRATNSNIIRVTPDIRADLAWFARYLAQYNANAVVPTERVVFRIWADACLKGAGASDRRTCLHKRLHRIAPRGCELPRGSKDLRVCRPGRGNGRGNV